MVLEYDRNLVLQLNVLLQAQRIAGGSSDAMVGGTNLTARLTALLEDEAKKTVSVVDKLFNR